MSKQQQRTHASSRVESVNCSVWFVILKAGCATVVFTWVKLSYTRS